MSNRILNSAVAIAALTVLTAGAVASAVKLNDAAHARALARLQSVEVLVFPKVTVFGQRELAPLARSDKNQATALR